MFLFLFLFSFFPTFCFIYLVGQLFIHNCFLTLCILICAKKFTPCTLILSVQMLINLELV